MDDYTNITAAVINILYVLYCTAVLLFTLPVSCPLTSIIYIATHEEAMSARERVTLGGHIGKPTTPHHLLILALSDRTQLQYKQYSRELDVK